MRILNFALAIIFLIFAFVQVNDPDPIIWILIYGAMAVVCVLAAFTIYPRKFLIFQGVAYFLYAIYYFPGVEEWITSKDKSMLFDNIAKMEFSYIEESREFLGLTICVAVIVFYLIRSRRR
jgi:hypothetical protein